MPGPYPREFREDVVAVARRRESGVTIKQIATDFGISEATLQNWLRQADVEEGNRPGQTAADAAEARELKKRIRLLEQENEVPGSGDTIAIRIGRPARSPWARRRKNNGIHDSVPIDITRQEVEEDRFDFVLDRIDVKIQFAGDLRFIPEEKYGRSLLVYRNGEVGIPVSVEVAGTEGSRRGRRRRPCCP